MHFWATILHLYTYCLGEFSNHLPGCSIKSSTLFLQIVLTGFDLYLYSCESSSADPALVENSNCKVFILNKGIVTDLADNILDGVEFSAHHPGSKGVANIMSVTML